MKAKTVYTSEMNWKELSEFPGEGHLKVLRDEDGGSARTLLVRLHAGGKVVPHVHVAAVQHYVLEGEYESEGSIYGAGTYRLIPGHANVAPISTQNGVTVLLIYDPAG